MLPATVKYFTFTADGINFYGRTESVTLPKINIKTDEFRGGGMDAPIEIDLGMDKMECGATLAEYSPQMLALFGKPSTQFQFSSSAQRQADAPVGMVVTVRGFVKESDPGDMKQGDRPTCKVNIAVTYYKLVIDGRIVHEVDVENMRRIIDGVDVLAAHRAILGI